MMRRFAPVVVAVVLAVVAVVLWVQSRTTTTVTEQFATTSSFEGFSVTYDSTRVAGPWAALSVVAAAVAVYLVMRVVRRR
ncbi:hypothetical protein [Rhodococcus sp. UNC23MFCrub1.1]|uniref:hypothetical protein n=1 Tax=Rhodococcus sp. UNC23MFCrub1.1 TaxID=1449068 RepID=UPI000A673D35|nr:hypothetical protein [Rhodococcus sp. UNC23MFCrub1.1]